MEETRLMHDFSPFLCFFLCLGSAFSGGFGEKEML